MARLSKSGGQAHHLDNSSTVWVGTRLVNSPGRFIYSPVRFIFILGRIITV